jgi:gluconate 2-dehydrogenase gamma chain
MFDRRSFLRGSSVLLTSAALGQAITAFAATPRRASHFNEAEMRELRALVDVILPATDSPAASAADTHLFIDTAIPLCATAMAQATFRTGLADLVREAFSSKSPAAQGEWLEARATRDMPLPYEQSFFRIVKDYTLTGYFLSETGATQALAYDKIPGGYWGDLPLAPNQKAWVL